MHNVDTDKESSVNNFGFGLCLVYLCMFRGRSSK